MIPALAAYEADNVFNPWDDCDPLDSWHGGYRGDMRRRDRLEQHFDCTPDYLLIGEAPGYQGCRFSGIPFTSERLIVEGKIPRVTSGRFTTRVKPWSEPSATIVWNTLHKLGIAERTVLWNAFAWHPHKPGEPYTNRTPTKQELLAGHQVLDAVISLFDGAKVIAVGMNAAWSLDYLAVKRYGAVRHPANGGAKLFECQLTEIVRRDPTSGELREDN